MAKQEKHQCSAHIRRGGWPDTCKRNASIQRDGKWYCKTHDPVRVEERRKKSNAADAARFDAKVRNRKCVAACEGFDDPIELRRQRDDLLAALIEYVAQDYVAHGYDAGIGGGTQEDAEAAIAKATK